MHIVPGDAITMLGKRGDELSELWLKYLSRIENHFPKPEESSAARPSPSSPPLVPEGRWTDLKQPLPSIPEEPEELSPVSSPDHGPPSPGSLTESGHGLTKEDSDSPPGPSTMPSADHGAHALPSPGPSTESDYEMVDATSPPGPASLTESDVEMVDVPWSPTGSASPIEFDHEMVGVYN